MKSIAQQHRQGFDPVCFDGGFVPANARNALKAHSKARTVAFRPVQPLEGDFQHQHGLGSIRDFAHRAEAIDGIRAHELVELGKLGVDEAEIGFADRSQPLAIPAGEDAGEIVEIAYPLKSSHILKLDNMNAGRSVARKVIL